MDCFGKERLEEYRGKHKLDVLLVYAVNPRVVEQAPGGRDNAKMVRKEETKKKKERKKERKDLRQADLTFFGLGEQGHVRVLCGAHRGRLLLPPPRQHPRRLPVGRHVGIAGEAGGREGPA